MLRPRPLTLTLSLTLSLSLSLTLSLTQTLSLSLSLTPTLTLTRRCYVELLTLHPLVLNYTSSSGVGFANMQKLGASLHAGDIGEM